MVKALRIKYNITPVLTLAMMLGFFDLIDFDTTDSMFLRIFISVGSVLLDDIKTAFNLEINPAKSLGWIFKFLLEEI